MSATATGLEKILNIANSSLGILDKGFNIFSTVSLVQAQVGLIDQQKHYYNVSSNIVEDTYKKKAEGEQEAEILNNAKRRYLYNQATPDDIKLLIKYDYINGYINSDGEAVVVENLLEKDDTDVKSVSKSDTDFLKKYLTKKNLMIAGGLYLLYKIFK